MLKEKGKLVLISQGILYILGILYLLESIFLRGLFTNVFLLLAVGAFTIVALIIALVKKELKLAIIDMLICLTCIGIFTYLDK